MSKYFVPVEIDGKWWVVECNEGGRIKPTTYKSNPKRPRNSVRYLTLQSDSAYWESKAGVKMTSQEFEVRNFVRASGDDNKVLNTWFSNEEICLVPHIRTVAYAIPLQNPTSKELIESEAERYASMQSFTLPVDNEYIAAKAFIHGATFALSLPKQDNGDAWDEAWHNFKRDTPHNFRNFKSLLDYFQQHYSISKK